MMRRPRSFACHLVAEVRGFTLIELLIVVAIVAVLSSIAVPAYIAYTVKTANAACLAEVKAYLQVSLAQMQDNLQPAVPIPNRCESITTMDESTEAIVGVAANPGNVQYTIDLVSGGLISEVKK